MSNFETLTFMDELFDFCIQQCVSDLHFEPTEQGLRLRYRQHGLIYNWPQVPIFILQACFQRFKALGGLDITPRRTPQDGQMRWKCPKNGNEMPCRLSTCPTPFGEKMAIRLMTHELGEFSFQSLGLSQDHETLIKNTCRNLEGLLLVTGPTGSGKTTTLYTILQYLKSLPLHIISVEDPIEIPLKNITQIELLPALNFGFKECLRTVLRQDPDIIMIGEIRDSISAKLAIQASQTGHLVLSSLHTPHGSGAFQRLRHLGVSSFDLQHEIRLIISQRLERISAHQRIASFQFMTDFSTCE
jgi:type II secretory ATPase GspE/PulE/Tfp pilus assembly ATPase PilB-like protein